MTSHQIIATGVGEPRIGNATPGETLSSQLTGAVTVPLDAFGEARIGDGGAAFVADNLGSWLSSQGGVAQFGDFPGVPGFAGADLSPSVVISGEVFSSGSVSEFHSGDMLIDDVIQGVVVLNLGASASGNQGSGQLYVEYGAVASGNSVGLEQVDGGGHSTGDITGNGDYFDDYGGITSGDVIQSGGTLAFYDNAPILSGQSGIYESSAIISAPVEIGGCALEIGAILSMGAVAVESGATLSVPGGAHGNGEITVSSGGMVVGDGGAAFAIGVDDFGSATGLNLVAGSVLILERGGVASDDVIGSGALEYLEGTANGEMIQSGGTLALEHDITSGQTVVAETVSDSLQIEGATLSSGASLVFFGHVLSGGTLSLAANAPESTAVVLSGGLLEGPGSIDFAEDFGVVSGVTEVSQGGLYVESGGVASGNTIDSVEFVSSGGVASDIIVSGATLVYGGALTSGQYVDLNGSSITSTTMVGGETLSSGATLSLTDPTIVDGATLFLGNDTTNKMFVSGGIVIVGSGGLAINTGVGGGSAIHTAGGATEAAKAGAGGVLRISGGGAVGTSVFSGGVETVLSSGIARGTVLSGGTEYDLGVTTGTKVLSGAHEFIQDHGAASGSVIAIGGWERVASGGVTVGATVSGGTLVLLSGAAILGGLAVKGGEAIISGTVAPGQWVRFTGPSGVLDLANLAGFGARISGLSTATQKIDVEGFRFGAGETAIWTQQHASGTLTLHDGAKSASLTLIGTYAASDFKLAGDGHGGTTIAAIAPPGAVAAAGRFAQAAAGLESGRSAALATVHAGGSALNDAPLIITATSGR